MTTNIKILIGVGSSIVLAVALGYWQRQGVKKLALKATGAFKEIFSNPGKLNSPDKRDSISRMKPELARRLMVFKKLLEKRGHRKKLVATSGVRTDRYNKKVGGVPGSEHTEGEGVDIATGNINNSLEWGIIASKAGFKRIGIANTFIHLGISKKLPQVAWTYSGVKIKKTTVQEILKKHYLKT